MGVRRMWRGNGDVGGERTGDTSGCGQFYSRGDAGERLKRTTSVFQSACITRNDCKFKLAQRKDVLSTMTD